MATPTLVVIRVRSHILLNTLQTQNRDNRDLKTTKVYTIVAIVAQVMENPFRPRDKYCPKGNTV